MSGRARARVRVHASVFMFLFVRVCVSHARLSVLYVILFYSILLLSAHDHKQRNYESMAYLLAK